jgi:hypothetical protein
MGHFRACRDGFVEKVAMARKVLKRSKLREQAAAAKKLQKKTPAAAKKADKTKPLGKPAGEEKQKVKSRAAALKLNESKPKKPRAKKLPPRMRVRWCIYDASMKPVAMFDYKQQKAAQASLAQYLEKKPNYFLQLVKEPLPLPAEPASAK